MQITCVGCFLRQSAECKVQYETRTRAVLVLLVDSTKISHIASVKHEFQNFNFLMDRYRNG